MGNSASYVPPQKESLIYPKFEDDQGSLDGKTLIRAHQLGDIDQPEKLGLDIADDLIQQGALDIIKDNV